MNRLYIEKEIEKFVFEKLGNFDPQRLDSDLNSNYRSFSFLIKIGLDISIIVHFNSVKSHYLTIDFSVEAHSKMFSTLCNEIVKAIEFEYINEDPWALNFHNFENSINSKSPYVQDLLIRNSSISFDIEKVDFEFLEKIKIMLNEICILQLINKIKQTNNLKNIANLYFQTPIFIYETFDTNDFKPDFNFISEASTSILLSFLFGHEKKNLVKSKCIEIVKSNNYDLKDDEVKFFFEVVRIVETNLDIGNILKR